MKNFAKINLNHLSHNLQTFRNKSKTEIFAVVKANAYGHGDIEVSKHLENEGVEMFCVSSIYEAKQIVDHIKADILIFGVSEVDEIEKYHHPQFIYTLGSLAQLNDFESLPFKVRVHIEVNTGMNRFGFKTIESLKQALHTKHDIEGIYTHFTSSEENKQKTLDQLSLFKEWVVASEYDFKYIHASNSHGALSVSDPILNASRVGIGLYGYSDFGDDLKEVLSLFTKVMHMDTLNQGESVGYNGVYTAEKNTCYGMCPIGYADGFDIRNSGLDVYIKGKPYPILGKICMDQMMIEVDEQVSIGDEVELIGPNRTLATVSKKLGVIPYIVLTNLGMRIERIYEK